MEDARDVRIAAGFERLRLDSLCSRSRSWSGSWALLDAASTGGGSCRPTPFTLAPGASCTLVVNPLANQVNGTVQVVSSSDSQSVAVTGTSLLNKGSAGSAAGLLGGLLMLGLAGRIQRRKSAQR